MFPALDKYKTNGHFFFKPTDSLDVVCNAPDNMDGVFMVYELKNGKITCVYIGASGLTIRDYAVEEGLMGLHTMIVTGLESKRAPNAQAWPVKMLSEKIDALDIYWWVTWGGQKHDAPADVKKLIKRTYKSFYGELPKWNRKVAKEK